MTAINTAYLLAIMFLILYLKAEYFILMRILNFDIVVNSGYNLVIALKK